MEKTQFEVLMLAITGLRTELKSEIGGLRNEFKADFKAEIGGLRNELKSEIGGLRNEFKADLKAEIGGLRNELGSKIDALSVEMKEMRTDIRIIREQVGKTVVDVADHEARISKLEGPSA